MERQNSKEGLVKNNNRNFKNLNLKKKFKCKKLIWMNHKVTWMKMMIKTKEMNPEDADAAVDIEGVVVSVVEVAPSEEGEEVVAGVGVVEAEDALTAGTLAI